ncbi:MAG: RNA methyltransferase, partial [Acetatifactor sp.]|nr:RNA methyltransferase [Acetatifactor sp.]
MSQLIRITDIHMPELELYSQLSEGQLAHYYEPDEGLFIAESPMIISRALDAGYRPVSLLMECGLAEGQGRELIARCGEIPVYVAGREVLEQITGYALTRGMLCAMYRRPLPTAEEVCRNAERIVVLEKVMNPTNVGAIFRSAAALNMDGVLLTCGSSDPLYRRAVRVSMG